jgi:hypothetical protein
MSVIARKRVEKVLDDKKRQKKKKRSVLVLQR